MVTMLYSVVHDYHHVAGRDLLPLHFTQSTNDLCPSTRYRLRSTCHRAYLPCGGRTS